MGNSISSPKKRSRNKIKVYSRENLMDNHPSFSEMMLELRDSTRLLDMNTWFLSADVSEIKIYQAWIQEPTARHIWIHYPTRTAPDTLTIMNVIASAKKEDIRVIAYFCKQNLWQRGSESEQLLRMIQSLAAQFLWLMPEEFSTDINLSEKRLSNCFKPGVDVIDVLRLFKELFSVIDGTFNTVVCVVDGLQMLQILDDRKRTRGLMWAIKSMCRCSRVQCDADTPILKVCFTTSHDVQALELATIEGTLDKIQLSENGRNERVPL